VLWRLAEKLPSLSRRYLAIDWDASAVRIAEGVVRGGEVRFRRAVTAPIPEDVETDDPQAFGGWLREILHQRGLHGGHVLMAVPRDRIALVSLRVPVGPVGELAGMVELQTARELSFPAEEAVLEFSATPAPDAPEFYDVEVGAVRHEVLDFYRSLAQAAGIRLSRLGLRPNANLLAITRGRSPLREQNILFVDVGKNAAEIDIFRGGRLAFSRAVTVAGDVASDLPVRGVLTEVLRTVEAYRVTAPEWRIDRIVVAGQCGIEDALVQALSERFRVEGSLYDAQWTVEVAPERAARMQGFCAALGLLIGQTVASVSRFDFLNPKRPVDYARVRRKKMAVAAGIAAGVLLAAGAAGQVYISSLENTYSQLNREVAELKAKAKKVEQLKKEVEAAHAWLKGEVIWLEELKKIIDKMPENREGYVTRLLANANYRRVRLEMHTRTAEVPNALAARLIQTGQYEVKPGSCRQQSNNEYKYTSDVTIYISLSKKKTRQAKPQSLAERTGKAESQRGG